MLDNKARPIKYLAIAQILSFTGCATTPQAQIEPVIVTRTKIKTVTIKKEYTPQLWSSHKVLNESPEMCTDKDVSILNSFRFKSVVKNANYVHGNFNTNRAAIKCVNTVGKTFVYIAAAGEKVKLVEKLRNEIAWKM